jgi:hypothetical protein
MARGVTVGFLPLGVTLCCKEFTSESDTGNAPFNNSGCDMEPVCQSYTMM